MAAMKGFVALLLVTAMARADDAKPLPVRRSVILASGGNYFVEGRQELRWGQELSVQRGTKIVGRGHGAMLVVSGALQVRGIKASDVIESVREEFKENEDLPNTTNPDDWARISGRKGERIINVRTLITGTSRTENTIETVGGSGQYL